jgi:hypothetical protein
VRLLGCVLAASAVLLLGACGGGDSTSAGDPAQAAPKLNRAQFVTRVNRLCREFDATVTGYFDQPNALADIPDVYEGFFQGLQSLGGPNEPRLRALIGNGYEIVEGYETVEQGVVHHDPDEIARGTSEVAEEKSKFAFAARGYGLDECSTGKAFTGKLGVPFSKLR